MVSIGMCTFWPPLVPWSSATHALFTLVQCRFSYIESQNNFTSDLRHPPPPLFFFLSKHTQTSQFVFAPAFSGPHSVCIFSLLVIIERHTNSTFLLCRARTPETAKAGGFQKWNLLIMQPYFQPYCVARPENVVKSWLIHLHRVFSRVFMQFRTTDCKDRLLHSCSWLLWVYQGLFIKFPFDTAPPCFPKAHDWTFFQRFLFCPLNCSEIRCILRTVKWPAHCSFLSHLCTYKDATVKAARCPPCVQS